MAYGKVKRAKAKVKSKAVIAAKDLALGVMRAAPVVKSEFQRTGDEADYMIKKTFRKLSNVGVKNSMGG